MRVRSKSEGFGGKVLEVKVSEGRVLRVGGEVGVSENQRR